VIESPDFLKSVDHPLRKLVKWLHERRIQTTPSCSGHHIKEKVFETIYSALEKDAVDIRNDGLQLQDVETGSIFTYRNKSYQLPWSLDEFIEKVGPYQQKGVIGLRLDEYKQANAALCNLQIDGVQFLEKDAITFIFTDGEDSKGDNKAIWAEITEKVLKVLEEYGVGAK
jgi:hypothetical protein